MTHCLVDLTSEANRQVNLSVAKGTLYTASSGRNVGRESSNDMARRYDTKIILAPFIPLTGPGGAVTGKVRLDIQSFNGQITSAGNEGYELKAVYTAMDGQPIAVLQALVEV